MIIDFHTHTFPDKIADKTIEYLAAKADVPYFRRGTAGALVESMQKAGIDYSVVLPVATAPRQVEGINRFAVENNGKDGLICFGGIHPDCENTAEILDGLKNAGIKGIKLHPDYQQCYFDDDRMLNIMRQAAERDMLVLTHAGKDYGFRDETFCTPDRVLNALKKLGSVIENKLILAHLGGVDYPDEVLEKLCGLPVYLDTSFVLPYYPDKSKMIIGKHGYERILFATDSPWGDQVQFVEIIGNMGFSEEITEMIFSGNARRILNMI